MKHLIDFLRRLFDHNESQCIGPRQFAGCVIAIMLAPSLSLAQNPAATTRAFPIRPAMTTPFPGNTGGYAGAVIGGGSQMPYLDLGTGLAAYPIGYYSAPWPGGFITPNGLYVPYGVAIGEFRVDIPTAKPNLPEPVVELSGKYPARLTLEFPAAAKLWLNGQAVAGDAERERELTSPVLMPGQQFTFKVRAQWDAKGRTYEYQRELTLGCGDRSRVLVVSGSALNDAEKHSIQRPTK